MAHSKSEIKKAKNLLSKYALKGEQLAFINSKEAKLLKKMGGAGKMTKAGIRSYAEDEEDQNAMNSSDYSSQDNEEQQSIDAGELTSQMSTASRDAQGSGSGTNINDLSSGNSILSTIGGFIKNAAGAAFTASTFGVGPAVGSLLYKGGKKVAKYINDSGRVRKVVDGPYQGDSFALTNKDFTKKNINFVNASGGGDNTPPARNVGGKIIKLSPTTAEISQSSATDAAAYDNRKTKAKGRSMTIMTSSRGINRNNTLTLGKPSLLGA